MTWDIGLILKRQNHTENSGKVKSTKNTSNLFLQLKISNLILLIVLTFSANIFSQTITVKGTIFEKDSLTPMPFAYVVNNRSSSGTLSDEKGNFLIKVTIGDSVSFSHLGYGITKIFTHLLKDSIKNNSLSVKIILRPKAKELAPVIISSHSFSKEEKEYYERKVTEYERGLDSPLASPITAMYYAWSKRGHELKKLSAVYYQLLKDEVREHRLSDEKIRVLTGNDTLNVQAFTNYCFLPDQFVVSASDYDLFLAIKRCYKQYSEIFRKEK